MTEKTKLVKVSMIEVGEHEQRMEDDPEVFAELVNSIGRLGLLNPLLVSEDDGRYVLVAGHRRLAAIKKLGYVEVLCMVRESSGIVDAEITFAENFCRKPLTPIEQAAAIKDCYEAGTLSMQDMAKAFHRSENWVAAQISMVGWPADVLTAIHQELISVSAAHNLAMVDEDVYRAFLLETAVSSGATARSTAAWLQGWRSSKSAEEAVQTQPVSTTQPQQPLVPQMPCLSCGTVLRMDHLSHVPMCQGCIHVIRNVGSGE